jgi:putative acetyltransferase
VDGAELKSSRAMTPTPDVIIALESPRQDDVRRLVAALDALMASLYPADSNHLLDIETLGKPDIRFFVARRGGEALGCGALRVAADYGEIKRMFVRPEARGLKLGRRILHTLEEQARREHLAFLRLETGISQPPAIALYRAAGFIERGPFGDYAPDPLSLFMEKRL